jgi:MFS family permease
MWAGGLAWLAVAGIMLGPVIGGAATATSPELVFSLVAVAAVALAGWALTLPPPPPVAVHAGTTVRAAIRDRGVRTGLWLMTLPALFSGTYAVLVPLRLDDLGATGVAIGAIFLGLAVIEATLSPIVGRLSDRRGRLVPMRLGLAGTVLGAILLPLPDAIGPLVAAAVVTVAALAAFWAPAMAMTSDAADAVGLDQGYAFAFTNLGWAGGQVIGGGGGSALAQATTDAVPYALLGALCLATLTAISRAQVRRGQFGHGRLPSAR